VGRGRMRMRMRMRRDEFGRFIDVKIRYLVE
jgi:hypothetical protein